MLLGLPLFLTEMTLVPLAFTERVRHNTHLPFPLLEISRFLLSLSESPWDLPSDLVPFWPMTKPVLFCAFLFVTGLTFTFIRSTKVCLVGGSWWDVGL